MTGSNQVHHGLSPELLGSDTDLKGGIGSRATSAPIIEKGR